MELKDTIKADLITAMKAKDQAKVETIRACKGAIEKYQKENSGKDIDYVKALMPLFKQRVDSKEQYLKAGYNELAQIEMAEMVVIHGYLATVTKPQLSKAEIDNILNNNSAFQGLKNVGPVMAYFKANYEGQYDTKQLSIVAKTFLKL